MKFRSHSVSLSVLVLMVVLSMGTGFAQIPNGGFETWTSGEPDGWLTNNNPTSILVTQSASSYTGASAVQGVVGSIMGFAIAPVLTSGSAGSPGFPVTQRYGSFHGFYQYSPTGGDRFYCTIVLTKNSTGVGGGAFLDTVAYASYREFIAPIAYIAPDVPDTAVIYFSVVGKAGSPHIGTTFLLDDLTLGAATDVQENHFPAPATYSLSENFPNPFNPSTTIEYTLPEQTRVHLFVTDITGRTVSELVNEQQPAGRYRAIFDARTATGSLTSGVYFYTLRTDRWSATNKLLLMK